MIHEPTEDGVLRIEGTASVEDAEGLLLALAARPGLRVDLRPCTHLHAACLGVLMAVRPPLDPPEPGSGVMRLLQAAWLTGSSAAAPLTPQPPQPSSPDNATPAVSAEPEVQP